VRGLLGGRVQVPWWTICSRAEVARRMLALIPASERGSLSAMRRASALHAVDSSSADTTWCTMPIS